ncbi:MAG: sensor histidine kinase [Symploca sp. SIO2G7]|nr:sensor histidine kinase [Symploca sp. SIO2G7]
MYNNDNSVDLLAPIDTYKANYAHQLQQTIDAYSIPMIVVGEAIQNAIDAVCEANNTEGIINICIDFDSQEITIQDNGNGFPKNISLLYLGGGTKDNKKLKGKVGVGIKVTLFCSEYFRVRSNLGNDTWRIEIKDAYKFKSLPQLKIPKYLPPDPNPIDKLGTQLSYRFPQEKKILKEFIHEIIDTTLPKGIDKEFGKSIKELNTGLPSPIATLLTVFLQRYSYVGDTLELMKRQDRYPKNGIKIKFNLKCSNPSIYFEDQIAKLFGDKKEQSFEIIPKYFCVEDSLKWVPKGKRKPLVFNDKLGRGGSNLERADGFNILTFNSHQDYESLITNKKGNLPNKIEYYRKHLFSKINAIYLAIGRIPDFEIYLPGGSRRLISCNGIVTSHNIDLTRGQNQAYVRCFDLIVDVDAQLNYGKTQLTSTRLVGWLRDYVNDAYVSVIQNATSQWVGKPANDIDDEDQARFLDKDNLELPDYTTRKIPRDENDVIGLFFEMTGRGLFPDYKVFGLSQRNRYDCGAVIKREKDTDSVFTPTDHRDLRTLEFKVQASELIRDFDRGTKDSRDIDLVIAWDEGNYSSKNYAIYDIDQSKAYTASPKRVFPSASKFIYDARHGFEVQVLLLKEIVFKEKAKYAELSE